MSPTLSRTRFSASPPAMNHNVLRALHGLAGASLLAIASAPVPTAAQAPELVYFPNITATADGGSPLTTVEEQTAGVLDALGEQLRSRGLDYGDVVVMNVFLRDTRHFQAMNGVYRGYFASDPPTRATVEADLPRPGTRWCRSLGSGPRRTGPR